MKIVKKKKRKRIKKPVLFAIPVLLYLWSVLFLRTYNNSLRIQIQSYEREISVLKEENAKLNNEITNLISKDRIMTIAQENGMKIDVDRVINLIP